MQYSKLGSRYIGYSNVNLVATEALDDVWISEGFNVTDLPKTFLVGVPSSIVRTSTVTGALFESLLAKNMSTDVR